jgi:hypothetical protein
VSVLGAGRGYAGLGMAVLFGAIALFEGRPNLIIWIFIAKRVARRFPPKASRPPSPRR